MSDISVLIVDDEPAARRGLKRLLAQEDGLAIVGEARNGREAVEKIEELRPDVVFLDIQMPELNGFEVLHAVRTEPLPVIVFVTAYDEWAVRAFEVEALDYVLKPFEDARLQAVVKRVRHRMREPGRDDVLQRVRALLAERGAAPRFLTRLLIRESGVVQFVELDTVDWIEAADYYARLHVGGRAQLVRYTLNQLEQQLDPSRFVRTHRSAIVNVAAIKEIRVAYQNQHAVVLKSGATVPLSRSKKERLEEVLVRAR
jgi:two-component system, LytTR family, response regulator